MKIKKYIIIDGNPVLFPVEFQHASMANNGTRVESAGFFMILQDKEGQLRVKCLGESTSLRLKSHPERDEMLITKYLGLDPLTENKQAIPEVSVYLNSEIECLRDLAKAMSKTFNEKIPIKDNCIQLPESVGKGCMSMAELSTGLALFKANVRFKNQVKFLRNVTRSNAHLYIHFNLSEASFMIKKENGRQVDVGVDWEEAIFYSSSGKSVEMELPEDKWVKWVTIIIHRSWLVNKQLNYNTNIGEDVIQGFLQNKSIQGMVNLTMEEMSLAFRLIEEMDQNTGMRLQTKGKVLQLLSLFVSKHVQDENIQSYADFSDVSRIMRIVGNLEKNPNNTWPTISLIARNCMMSRTKFITLFKSIYGKSYHNLMMDIRMQKAAEFLQIGEAISEVGQKVGFSNLSHFAKTFKQVFHIEPSKYKHLAGNQEKNFIS
ncbi:helix-turn-helix transcriptional regulator [Sphingobacterium spiritivorum]|uniref:Transcriptional regulator, AraC family n=1 Tax=Sphingobacterium spiritivorum ATCC 33861 TaxID=525373 RepID=D7VGP4_SPHSI|nr:helix-turn-helix transcriptional regulator [Sphingobacterium spiritivorum]EFK59246.1 transcriptional regulator, AraC family [Sphingobacterium spiritivorum ATCC 33861]QQT34051.1 helix-turn-helix transcriptional regulator [Sphingobacterium spiritivorum]WQD34880.1 helix-turn-helix transcriptional regulator [Sphingobacterium spiritivorum]SUI98604.1 DNA-binding transcriptional regulator AraC [Sphingobacterium spiritivorum]